MDNIKKIGSTALFLFSVAISSCTAQIKNAKTETAKVYGNCGMCEKKIENAGNIKGIAKVDWDKDTKIATLTYDAKKTSKDEILKRVASVGYDNESYRVPDELYNDLHSCCQYDRPLAMNTQTITSSSTSSKAINNTDTAAETDELTQVFEHYFELKDALVKTDGIQAASKAKYLFTSFNNIEMKKLSAEQHAVWMEVLNALKTDASKIMATQSTAQQRKSFVQLSENIYKLVKVSSLESTVYYDNCPMYNSGKGANWLSKENNIKNPYYGAQMLNCGSVKETIQTK